MIEEPELALKEAMRQGIDAERARSGEDQGPPYTAREWDAAACTIVAMNVLKTPFAQRRGMLLRQLLGFLDEGFFRPAGDDDTL